MTAPVSVQTPFAAPDNNLTFTPPLGGIPCNVASIASKGAVQTTGSQAANRAAINKAIADLSAAGGGVIEVPMGTWPTGALTLKSNIELHLDQGAVLSFSAATADYQPAVLTRWEGIDCQNWQPGIYAIGETNVAITGPGTIHGPGMSWGGGTASWKTAGTNADMAIYNAWLSGNVAALKTSGPPTLANMAQLNVPVSMKSPGLRPTFIECNGCNNFMVDGPTIDGGWYWNVHPLYSSNVIVRNVTVNSNNGGTNGDGTDPDSSTDVLIENVTYNTSDDMIAIKSGTNEPGFNILRPSHNIVAHNIKVQGGHGFSIGSELSGGVNNVYLYNDMQEMWSGPPQYLFRIKTPPGRGAVEIKNIWFQDVTGVPLTMKDVLVTNTYSAATIPGNTSVLGTPTFSNITIKNVIGMGSSSCMGVKPTLINTTLPNPGGC